MKKIAICGKGGSGKSITTSLLSLGIRRRGKKVLVIDADESNPGLHRMLGFKEPPEPLIDYVGGKAVLEKKIQEKMKSGIPEEKVNIWTKAVSIAEIPPDFIKVRDGISFTTIGKIYMALEGCACPMGIVSRSFLNELILEPDEIALIDMEAGIEHFGRGVETGTDCVLVVVEPSRDSLDVALKVKQMSDQIDIGDTWAILNKVPSEDIARRITDELAQEGLNVIGSINFDKEIFEICLTGGSFPQDKVNEGIEDVLDHLFP
ncbi:MAG: P-loop NTPase [Syntrophales bacterium]|jgi:CO dehydrogenase maturation factor|nr:P-loop NTPase [Syntrophales bacterium]MDY0044312.1 P-loop NTPase [Syntrophales bacterium]